MFTRARRATLLVLLSVTFGLATANVVAAASPIAVSGSFTYQGATIAGVRVEGGNVIIDDLSAAVAYSGTFTGTSSLHGRLILHPDGTANYHDVEVFTGTVDGMPGTVTFVIDGRTDRGGVVTGTDTVTSASGSLAGLHGVLDLTGTVPDPAIGPAGSYAGQIVLPS